MSSGPSVDAAPAVSLPSFKSTFGDLLNSGPAEPQTPALEPYLHGLGHNFTGSTSSTAIPTQDPQLCKKRPHDKPNFYLSNTQVITRIPRSAATALTSLRTASPWPSSPGLVLPLPPQPLRPYSMPPHRPISPALTRCSSVTPPQQHDSTPTSRAVSVDLALAAKVGISAAQARELERLFVRRSAPSNVIYTRISEHLDVSRRAVTLWFMYRRRQEDRRNV
ncbi:hypothetical protein BC830DRAFT_339533 [Chytriomyces sp. MP71]|nr:hypothetical protein BC830DRAFT_339533 [Chytriomyces sp. MP71]